MPPTASRCLSLSLAISLSLSVSLSLAISLSLCFTLSDLFLSLPLVLSLSVFIVPGHDRRPGCRERRKRRKKRREEKEEEERRRRREEAFSRTALVPGRAWMSSGEKMSVTSPSPLCMWNLAFVPSSKCSPDTCRIATVSTHGCGVKSTMGVGEGEKIGHGSAASVHRACCVVQRCARSDSACSVDSWRCFSSRVLPQAQPHADTGPWHLRIPANLVLTYAGIHGRFGKSYHASTLLASVLQPDHPVVTL